MIATQPCRLCNAPVAKVRVASGESVTLDPAAPVYMREADGEGGVVWARFVDEAIMGVHRCRVVGGAP